jgi:hypothetical protein
LLRSAEIDASCSAPQRFIDSAIHVMAIFINDAISRAKNARGARRICALYVVRISMNSISEIDRIARSFHASPRTNSERALTSLIGETIRALFRCESAPY